VTFRFAARYFNHCATACIISNYNRKTYHTECFIYAIMVIKVFKHFLRTSVVKALQTKNPDCHGISALIFQTPFEVCGARTGRYVSVELFCLIDLRVGRVLSRYTDWLRAGRSGDRIPVGARFSAPVQSGLGAHPASCTMGTGYIPRVESGRGVTLTPQPLLELRSKNRVALYLCSP
jgi:hypothetical protein